jgi:urease accessory protein
VTAGTELRERSTAPGLLDLEFRRDPSGRSTLHARRQRFPLRITAPFHLDEAAPDIAFVYVQNPTGGVFADDSLETTVRVGPGARVHLTSQSATKLYRGASEQHLQFELSAGAYAEHIPDPLIPHAGACYRQATVADLGTGAMFLTAETIAPGRRAHGERFAYKRLDLSTSVSRRGRELFADRLRLEPGRARVDRPGVLADGDYLVSLLAVAPDADVEALSARVDAALAGHGGAAGELPNRAGVVGRAIASTADAADRALRSAWRAARLELIGVPLPERRK